MKTTFIVYSLYRCATHIMLYTKITIVTIVLKIKVCVSHVAAANNILHPSTLNSFYRFLVSVISDGVPLAELMGTMPSPG